MKQDYQRIEKLIERFFEGQTSNEEEQELYAFFSSEKVPEHLLPYSPVFVYFETGIKEEESNLQIVHRTTQTSLKKKIRIWASVAASLLVLLSFGIHHFVQKKEYDLYEGSYIIRNGVKITDPKIVVPEIKKTLYCVQQREKEIQQLHLDWIEQIEDVIIRNEFLEIVNIEL